MINVALLAIVLIAIFLRFFLLGKESIWLDEAFTLQYSQQSFQGIFLNTSHDVHPPLFYWIEHIFLSFGTREVILRLFPAIAGICTIPVVYFIGEKLYGRQGGLIAASFIAFSIFHISYSQEARMYSFVFLLFCIAFFFFITQNPILFGIFSALAFWTHFLSIIPIVALFIIKFDDEKFLKKSIPVFMIGILPLMIFITPIFTSKLMGLNWGMTGFTLLFNSLFQIMGACSIGFFILSALTILGAIFIQKRYSIAFLIIIASLLILSYYIPTMPRYTIFLLLFIAIIIAAPATFFPRYYPWISIILIILLSISPLMLYYGELQKDDWRGVGIYFQELSVNETIKIIPGYHELPFRFYATKEFNLSSENNTQYIIIVDDPSFRLNVNMVQNYSLDFVTRNIQIYKLNI